MDGVNLNELATMLDESMKLAEKSGLLDGKVLSGTVPAVGQLEAAAAEASARLAKGSAAAQQPAPMVESTFGQGFKAPEYTFMYKQRVDSAEVYGGFSGQTPSNADSQYFVVNFKLPGEVGSDIDLDVTEMTLTLYAKIHRLHLVLPHHVDPKDVKASFANQVLRVTLRRTDVMLI